MTENIWDEIPNVNDDKYWLLSARLPPGEKEFMSLQFSMDLGAWSSRLKAHYDVTTNSIQVYEWKEKAEKWDNYLEAIKDSIPHVSLADYEILEDKLEALRNAMPQQILHTDYRSYAASIEKFRRILGETKT